MVAGGDRLSLTESADEKGTAEQGKAKMKQINPP